MSHSRVLFGSLTTLALLVAIAVSILAPLGIGSAAQDASPSASPTAVETFDVGGSVETPLTLTVADLQALDLTAETVDVTYESRDVVEDHTFTGVRLLDLLETAGIPAGAQERNPLLGRYVVITAKDGYQVVLSGGELDPNFGATPVLLAWEQDGEALAGDDGPVRLVVPGDRRGGRYVYGVISIELRELAPAAATTPAA